MGRSHEVLTYDRTKNGGQVSPASLQPDIACSDKRVSCICLGNDACSFDGRIAHRVIF